MRCRSIVLGTGALTACLLLLACHAHACDVPVFRYALENWRPASYRAVILHRGSLTERDETLVSRLEAMAANAAAPINLEVARGDVSKTAEFERLSKNLGYDFDDIKAPEIVLLYPKGKQGDSVAWRGPLTAKNVAAMIDSPARRQLVQWLVDGESAVWVFIPTGDEAKDNAAQQRLTAELLRLEETITLRKPKTVEEEKDDARELELRVGFKLLVLDPDDPQEKLFAAMLLGSQNELQELDQPVATPIYGRGRTWKAIAGEQINVEAIEKGCRFVTGACACEVKRKSPGIDLLLPADWDELIPGRDEGEPLPELNLQPETSTQDERPAAKVRETLRLPTISNKK